jgi:hypothetical protein
MGKNKYIESPEKLLEYFKQYKKFEEDNRLFKREYVGKEGREVDTPLHYPITMEAFETWLFNNDIIQTLSDYISNKNKAYGDYSAILTHIKKEIFAHNFRGASVQLLNPSLIARQLGIKDQQDVTSDNKPLESNKTELTVKIIRPIEED